MKTNYIVLTVLGILFIPVLLNIVLGAPNPLSNISVIGDSTHWLAFYGSYIGGILTAIIGFVTLHRESVRGKLQLTINSKEDALKELKLSLSERIGLFDFSRVIEISLHPKDKTMYSTMQRELSEYHNLLSSKANAWAVVYASSNQLEIVKFNNSYIDCCNVFNECINSVTMAICHLSKSKTDEEIDLILETEIVPISRRTIEVKEKLQNLFHTAQEWIKVEEMEIEKLKGLL